MPASDKMASKSRSRRCSQASRMACISAAVTTRGSFFGGFRAMVRRACGLPGITPRRNGLNPPFRWPSACQVVSSSPTQRRAVPGGRRKRPAPPACGPPSPRPRRFRRRQHRHQAVPPSRRERQPGHVLARSSSRTSRQSTPGGQGIPGSPSDPVAYAFTVFGDRSMLVRRRATPPPANRDVVIAQDSPRLSPDQGIATRCTRHVLHFTDVLDEA